MSSLAPLCTAWRHPSDSDSSGAEQPVEHQSHPSPPLPLARAPPSSLPLAPARPPSPLFRLSQSGSRQQVTFGSQRPGRSGGGAPAQPLRHTSKSEEEEVTRPAVRRISTKPQPIHSRSSNSREEVAQPAARRSNAKRDPVPAPAPTAPSRQSTAPAPSHPPVISNSSDSCTGDGSEGSLYSQAVSHTLTPSSPLASPSHASSESQLRSTANFLPVAPPARGTYSRRSSFCHEAALGEEGDRYHSDLFETAVLTESGCSKGTGGESRQGRARRDGSTSSSYSSGAPAARPAPAQHKRPAPGPPQHQQGGFSTPALMPHVLPTWGHPSVAALPPSAGQAYPAVTPPSPSAVTVYLSAGSLPTPMWQSAAYGQHQPMQVSCAIEVWGKGVKPGYCAVALV